MTEPGPSPVPDKRPVWVRSRAVLAVLLAVLTVLVYGPAIRCQFVELDDRVYVVDNPHLNLGFTSAGWQWLATGVVLHTWHPLTMASHMLDVRLFGLENPGGHHLTSVVIHALSTALVYLVLGRLSGSWGASLATACLWGWHPLRVESVAWIAERKDVLSGLFFLLTLAAYQRYVDRPGIGRYLLVVVCLALGLLAKPMLVTVPCVLLLLDFWPLGRWKSGQAGSAPPSGSESGSARFAWSRATDLVVEKLPLLALVAADSLLTLRTQQTVVEGSSQPWALRLGHIALAYGDYLRQIVWPVDLAPYYPRWPASEQWGRCLVYVLLLAIISLIAWRQSRSRPWLAVGWLWFLGMLVPVVGFVQVGAQARADRYTYLPSLGLTWAVALSVAQAAAAGTPTAGAWRRWLPVASAALGVALAIGTWRQVGYWTDSETLFRHALAVTERNVVMEEALALVLAKTGRPDEALERLDRALAIQPTYARALYDRGYLLARLGRLDEADASYRRTLALGYRGLQIRLDYGRLLLDRKQFAEAQEQFAAAQALNTQVAEVWLGLGEAELGRGNLAEAERNYAEALRLDPNSLAPRFALIRLWAGSPEGALRRPEQALELAEQLAAQRPDDWQVCDALAAALAANGQFRAAVASAERAQKLFSAAGPAGQAASAGDQRSQLEDRLRRYRAGLPYRLP